MNKEVVNKKYSGTIIFIWVFIFLFFILYNVFSKIGIFPKIFGGFYTFSITLSSILVFKLFPNHIWLAAKGLMERRITLINCIDIIFLLFLFLFSSRVLIGFIENKNTEIVEFLGGAVIRFFVLYIICIYIPLMDNKFYKINFYSFCVASIVLLLFYSLGGNEFVIREIDHFSGVDYELDYQGVALAYSVLTIFGLNHIKNANVRILLWIFSLFLLFLIDARSEFVLQLIVFLGVEFVLDKNRLSNFLRITMFTVVAIPICFLFLSLDNHFEINSRMSGLIDVSADESMLGRKYLNDLGYRVIGDNLFFGDFASYLPGQYMHNIFSVWIDLGFLGFFLLALVFTFCAIVALHSGLTRPRAIALMLLVACLILLVFVKAYFYILLPISLGLFVASYSKKNI